MIFGKKEMPSKWNGISVDNKKRSGIKIPLLINKQLIKQTYHHHILKSPFT
jgi:hypothetical protein